MQSALLACSDRRSGEGASRARSQQLPASRAPPDAGPRRHSRPRRAATPQLGAQADALQRALRPVPQPALRGARRQGPGAGRPGGHGRAAAAAAVGRVEQPRRRRPGAPGAPRRARCGRAAAALRGGPAQQRGRAGGCGARRGVGTRALAAVRRRGWRRERSPWCTGVRCGRMQPPSGRRTRQELCMRARGLRRRRRDSRAAGRASVSTCRQARRACRSATHPRVFFCPLQDLKRVVGALHWCTCPPLVKAARLQQVSPLFQTAKALLCARQPGDALFIPEGWWHSVRSAPASAAVNLWWRSPCARARPALGALMRGEPVSAPSVRRCRRTPHACLLQAEADAPLV